LLNNVWDENAHDSKVLREFAPVEERLCSNRSTCGPSLMLAEAAGSPRPVLTPRYFLRCTERRLAKMVGGLSGPRIAS
jgi:hypothetical protein